jgi:predicted transposase YdaD
METEEGALRVLRTIRDTGASEADRKALTTIIMKRASDAARQILEHLMATTEWKSDFIESYVNVGIEQGLAQGAISAKAAAIIKALDVRQLQPTAQQLAQVTESTDLDQLDRWFERSLTAATAAEVFRD